MKSGWLWKPPVITAMVAETGSSYSKQAWRGVRNGKFLPRVSVSSCLSLQGGQRLRKVPRLNPGLHTPVNVHTHVQERHTHTQKTQNSGQKSCQQWPQESCSFPSTVYLYKMRSKKKNLSLGGRNTHMHIHIHLYIYEVKNLSMWEGT